MTEIDRLEPCQSYRPGEQLCRDGFPQSALCRGHADAGTPFCLSEQAPPHLFDEAGKPRFAEYLRTLETSNV